MVTNGKGGERVAIDLSQTLCPGMPFFPGTEPPAFDRPFTVERDGFAEQRLTLLTHVGTHMDAPAHLIAGGATLEQLGLPHFAGPAALLDLPRLPGAVVAAEDLRRYAPRLAGKSFVLLRTGWSARWGSDAYFRGFPVLSEEAALFLAGFAIRGVGVDAASFDPADSLALPAHHAFLARAIVLIENLTNLDAIFGDECDFCCLPLKLVDGDGAPARAVAWVGRRGEGG